MVAIIDSPDFMFNDINISSLSKSKKFISLLKVYWLELFIKTLKENFFVVY